MLIAVEYLQYKMILRLPERLYIEYLQRPPFTYLKYRRSFYFRTHFNAMTKDTFWK